MFGASAAEASCGKICNVTQFRDQLDAMCSLDTCANCTGCNGTRPACVAPCNHLDAYAYGNIDDTEKFYPSSAIKFGETRDVFDVAGGCGGRDIGRCGVTAQGKLYAWYLDAVAWCEDTEPGAGYREGQAVSEGCSIATRAGYYTRCCVGKATSDPNKESGNKMSNAVTYSSPWPLLALSLALSYWL